MGTARNLLGVVAAPVVPILLVARTYRDLSRRARLTRRNLAALPWVLLFDIMWALGEARGHLHALRQPSSAAGRRGWDLGRLGSG